MLRRNKYDKRKNEQREVHEKNGGRDIKGGGDGFLR